MNEITIRVVPGGDLVAVAILIFTAAVLIYAWYKRKNER